MTRGTAVTIGNIGDNLEATNVAADIHTHGLVKPRVVEPAMAFCVLRVAGTRVVIVAKGVKLKSTRNGTHVNAIMDSSIVGCATSPASVVWHVSPANRINYGFFLPPRA